jgi:hypothetical protein
MRYYFDMLDGGELKADELGIEFSDDHSALVEALRSLRDWAHDSIDQSDTRDLTLVVREDRREIGRLHVKLKIVIPPPLVGTV